MSHAVIHPVNKTAHTGINQFHVASQVSGYEPPGCQYFCKGANVDCLRQCPDGTCANGNLRCPSGTYLAGSCPRQTMSSDPSCDNPNS